MPTPSPDAMPDAAPWIPSTPSPDPIDATPDPIDAAPDPIDAASDPIDATPDPIDATPDALPEADAAPIDPGPPPPACRNALDDDGDGLIDALDPGCATLADRDERDPPTPPGCANGEDDDLDGLIDLDDPDCVAAGGEEGPAPACANGRDDDGDGELDRDDPGCASARDDDETDPPRAPQCANGVDDDLDGRFDRADPECTFAGQDDEGPPPACANGLDDDGDGAVDALDPGCAALLDDEERDPVDPPACGNGFDDDLDGRVDLDDPECTFAGQDDEGPAPACADGRDNDGDDRVDLDDPGCAALDDRDERDPARHPTCADGLDNDGDGAIDRLDDDCPAAGAEEGVARACANRLDDDGDGLIDRVDPGCADAADDDERDPMTRPACANGRDDDFDGRVDFPADPECVAAGADDEGDQPACANGLDDEGDGIADFPLDPGCVGPADDDETDPDEAPACANGVDDDRDGSVDFPADRSCAAAADDDEGRAPACADGLDGDGDGWVDLDDPGCAAPLDDDEADPADAPACANGLDDDLDGATDYPLDERCVAAGHDDEGPRPACANGRDDDGDGRIDLADPGCGALVDPTEDGEGEPLPACGNGLDDDGDGAIDYPVDPGCRAAGEDDEAAAGACGDGLDNDGDGRVDADDPGCTADDDADEADPEPPPTCANGRDDDLDGLIDHPDDPSCARLGADGERPVCPPEIWPVVVRPDPLVELSLDRPDGAAVLAPRCGEGQGREAVVALRLDSPGILRVEAHEAPVVLALRRRCGEPASEVICRASAVGGSAALVHAIAEAGDWLLVVQWIGDAAAPVELSIRLEVSDRTACENGIDDDDDGRVDLADPGCHHATDGSELDPVLIPGCANGRDDDGDGAIDHPADPDCLAAGAPEAPHPCPAFGGPWYSVGPGRSRLELSFPAVAGPIIRHTCEGSSRERRAIQLRVEALSLVSVRVIGAERYEYSLGTACVDAPIACASTQRDGGFATMLAPGTYLLEVGFVSSYRPNTLEVLIDIDGTPAACGNGIDDDGDGRVDADDPGCDWLGDNGEADGLGPPPECANGDDDDTDGLVDGADPDCDAATAWESGGCGFGVPPPIATAPGRHWHPHALTPLVTARGIGDACDAARPLGQHYAIDLDRRSRVALRDAGLDAAAFIRRRCTDPASEIACGAPTVDTVLEPGRYIATQRIDAAALTEETEVIIDPIPDAACDNGIDDDFDGRIDRADPGCVRAMDDDEADPPTPPTCANGIDDDADGLEDYPLDPQCRAAGDPHEQPLGGQPATVHAPLAPEGGRVEFVGDPRDHISLCQTGLPGTVSTAATIEIHHPSWLDARAIGMTDPYRFRLEGQGLARCLDGPQWGITLNPGQYSLELVTPLAERGTLEVNLTPIPPPACDDGLDNDEDGRIDAADPGCLLASDDDERPTPPPCPRAPTASTTTATAPSTTPPIPPASPPADSAKRRRVRPSLASSTSERKKAWSSSPTSPMWTVGTPPVPMRPGGPPSTPPPCSSRPPPPSPSATWGPPPPTISARRALPRAPRSPAAPAPPGSTRSDPANTTPSVKPWRAPAISSRSTSNRSPR
jgi:hypothetical protein